MKNSILFFTVFFAFSYAFSQNTFPTSNNSAVGLGTGITPVNVPTGSGLRLKITSGTPNTSGIQLTNLNSTSTPVTTNVSPLGIDNNGNIVITSQPNAFI